MKRLIDIGLLIVTIVVALMLVVSAYGGLVDPRWWSLPAVATLALPVVVVVALVWLVVLVAARAWRSVVVMLAALLACAAPISRVIALGVGGNVDRKVELKHTFTMMQFNVGGTGPWTKNRKREPNAIFQYILEQNPDVVILQEASLGSIHYEDIPAINVILDSIDAHYPYREHGYHDVIILSKYPYERLAITTIDPCILNPDCESTYSMDIEAYDVSMPAGRVIRFIGYHLQPIGLKRDDKDLFRDVTDGKVRDRETMQTVKNTLIAKLRAAYELRATEAEMLRGIVDSTATDLVLCGDMNDTPASWTYRTLMGDDLHDVYPEVYRGYMNTYNKDRFLFRIDHVMYRGNLRPVSLVRGDAITSDHYPQFTTFEY